MGHGMDLIADIDRRNAKKKAKAVRKCDKKLRVFFREHPVHRFTVAVISRYLGLPEDVVKESLDALADSGYLIRTPSASPQGIAEFATLTVGDGIADGYKLRLSDGW